MRSRVWLASAAALAAIGLVPSVGAQSTVSVVNYQGILKANGSAATGTFDLCFQFWSDDMSLNCTSQGTRYDDPNQPICVTVTIDASDDGLFSVNIPVDSSSLYLLYDQVYIEILIGPHGGPLTPQCPRQRLTSTFASMRSRFSLYSEQAAVAGVATGIELPIDFFGESSIPLITVTQNGLGPAILVAGTSAFGGTVAFNAPTPFTLPSPTLIPNLNAQLLNGRAEDFLRNAGNLNAGVMPDGRLSGTYSSKLTFSDPNNIFTGIGSGLAQLNASNLSSGFLPSARLSGTYTSQLTLSNVSNSFSGNGALLTSLNAGNVASGTLPVVRGGTGLTAPGTPGSLLYSTSTGYAFSAQGSSGQVLRSGAGQGVPLWGAVDATELTGVLPISKGGTGSSTQNFLRLDVGQQTISLGNNFDGNNNFGGVNYFSNTNTFSFTSSTTNPTLAVYRSGAGSPTNGALDVQIGAAGRAAYLENSDANWYTLKVQNNASGLAGGFFGNVYISGTLTCPNKQFRIDHPLDPENLVLDHACVESDEMKNVYDGVTLLNAAGEAWVQLPGWFEALNGNFRYQLTCLGGYAPVYIADEVQDNRFRIAGGTAGLKISWQVTGVRHDAYANAHRLVVEKPKSDRQRGYYLNPEAFGQPESRGVSQLPDDSIGGDR